MMHSSAPMHPHHPMPPYPQQSQYFAKPMGNMMRPRHHQNQQQYHPRREYNDNYHHQAANYNRNIQRQPFQQKNVRHYNGQEPARVFGKFQNQEMYSNSYAMGQENSLQGDFVPPLPTPPPPQPVNRRSNHRGGRSRTRRGSSQDSGGMSSSHTTRKVTRFTTEQQHYQPHHHQPQQPEKEEEEEPYKPRQRSRQQQKLCGEKEEEQSQQSENVPTMSRLNIVSEEFVPSSTKNSATTSQTKPANNARPNKPSSQKPNQNSTPNLTTTTTAATSTSTAKATVVSVTPPTVHEAVIMVAPSVSTVVDFSLLNRVNHSSSIKGEDGQNELKNNKEDCDSNSDSSCPPHSPGPSVRRPLYERIPRSNSLELLESKNNNITSEKTREEFEVLKRGGSDHEELSCSSQNDFDKAQELEKQRSKQGSFFSTSPHSFLKASKRQRITS